MISDVGKIKPKANKIIHDVFKIILDASKIISDMIKVIQMWSNHT